MEHIYKIYPKNKRYISGILPNRKQITEPTTVKNLNRSEFLRCMASGEVHAIVDGVEIPIMTHNFEEAEAVFDVTDTPKIIEPENDLIAQESKDNIENIIDTDENIIPETCEETIDSEKVELESDENDTVDANDSISDNIENESNEDDIVTSGYVEVINSEEDKQEEPLSTVTVAVSAPANMAMPKPNKNSHHGKHYGKSQNVQSNYSNHNKK